jgi:hypothetical protein
MTRTRRLAAVIAVLGSAGAVHGRASTPLEARVARDHAEMQSRLAEQAPRRPTVDELRSLLTAHGSPVPVNLANGSDAIQAATWNDAQPPVSGAAGWNYDAQAGRIWPNCRITPRSAPADRSLAIEEYRRKGVPDPGGAWSGRSADEAARAVKKASRLPRLDSPRSGALFARMTSPGNLDGCRDRKRPVENRLVDAAKHLSASGDLLRTYGKAYANGEVGDLEPIEVHAHCMRVAALIAELGDEVLADGSGNSAAQAARRKSVERIHDGLAMLIEGSLEMLEQMETSTPDRRRRFLQGLAQTAPGIAARLPPLRRARIIDLVRAADAPDLQPGLAQLADAMDEARAAAEAR